MLNKTHENLMLKRLEKKIRGKKYRMAKKRAFGKDIESS